MCDRGYWFLSPLYIIGSNKTIDAQRIREEGIRML